MKKNNFKIVKIDKGKSLFNYEKKILINELILDLKLGYYDFERENAQKVKFSLEIDYQDKKPSNDKDLKSYAIVIMKICIFIRGESDRIKKLCEQANPLIKKNDIIYPHNFTNNHMQYVNELRNLGHTVDTP